VSAAVVLTRIAWFFTIPYLLRAIDRRPAQHARRVGAADRFVVAWSGMRGAVSLAVALALPLSTDAGESFPQRDLIVFLAFAVIFFTLVVQGLSLPGLIRRLRVSDGGADADEEIRARLVATKAALAELDALAREDWPREETVQRLRRFYEYRKRRFAARAGKIEDDGYEDRTLAYQRTLQAVVRAQREALLRMRSDGGLSNETMNRILHELDLEESRLEI
jgi:CPA1 family monovalent cation:H+ antiporter